MIDAAFHHLPRPLRNLRMKEWEAVQLVGLAVFVNVALSDAKLMALMQAKIDHRESRVKSIDEWTLRPGAFTVGARTFRIRTAKAGFVTENSANLEVFAMRKLKDGDASHPSSTQETRFIPGECKYEPAGLQSSLMTRAATRMKGLQAIYAKLSESMRRSVKRWPSACDDLSARVA